MSEIKLIHYDEILDGLDVPSKEHHLLYNYYGMFEIRIDDRVFYEDCSTSYVDLVVALLEWINSQQFELSSFEYSPEDYLEEYPMFAFKLDDHAYRLESFFAEFQSTREYTIVELAGPVFDFIRSVQVEVHRKYQIDIMAYISKMPNSLTSILGKTDTLIPIESPLTD